MKVLMSIKPDYVEKIFNGTKKYEYRKILPKENVASVIVYATNPVKKVVGEITIRNIIIDTKEKVWHKTKNYSGTTKDFYDEYFKDREIAIAYEIDKVIKYEISKDLSEFGISYPPQSFIYIK